MSAQENVYPPITYPIFCECLLFDIALEAVCFWRFSALNLFNVLFLSLSITLLEGAILGETEIAVNGAVLGA